MRGSEIARIRKKRKPPTRGWTAVIQKQFKDMKKLSEKQSPNFVEMRKTLVGLGNVLVQAGLADGITYLEYPTIKQMNFSCGDFSLEITEKEYDTEKFDSFVKSVEDYMKQTIKDYEHSIFEMECAKAIMEVYLTKEN